MSSIGITLRDENGGARARYICVSTPWRLFKAATRLVGINSSTLTGEEWENLAGLVVEIFGNRFTIEDLRHNSPGELIGVANQLMRRVNELLPDKTADGTTDGADGADGTADGADWTLRLESSLIKILGWSMRDIDECAVESLLPVVMQFAGDGPARTAYCDQVDFL